MLESIAVFVFIKSRWSKKTYISNKFRNIICALAQYSFGIYLVHVLVIEILQNVVGLDTLSFNAGLSVPIITIIVSAFLWQSPRHFIIFRFLENMLSEFCMVVMMVKENSQKKCTI